MPAMVLNQSLYCRKTRPKAEAANPNSKNTVERPITKNSAGTNADFGLPSRLSSLTETPLFSEDFLLVRPAAQADAPVPSREELRDMRLLLLEEGHCFRDQALSFCNIRPSPPREMLDGSSLSTLVQMVGAGIGVTLIPEMAVNIETRSAPVSVARFNTPQPSRTIGMVWRKTSPLSQQLVQISEIEHDLLKRDGSNLHYDLYINVADAALGCSPEVPTVDGKVKINLDEGVQSGKVLRLRSKGLPSVNGYGKGDLFVHVNVWTPKDLNKEQKEFFKSMRSQDNFQPQDIGKEKSFFDKVKDVFS